MECVKPLTNECLMTVKKTHINNEKQKLQDLVNVPSKFTKLVKYLEAAVSYHTSNNAPQKHFWW